MWALSKTPLKICRERNSKIENVTNRRGYACLLYLYPGNTDVSNRSSISMQMVDTSIIRNMVIGWGRYLWALLRMGRGHVPTLLPPNFQRAIYLTDLESRLLSLWYFSLYHKTNIYAESMRRLLSVSVNCTTGERYISYKITHWRWALFLVVDP